MLSKKLVGGILGIFTAILAMGVAVGAWQGARLPVWAEVLLILLLVGLAAFAFYLWTADEHKNGNE